MAATPTQRLPGMLVAGLARLPLLLLTGGQRCGTLA
jgi:hypothetical protein